MHLYRVMNRLKSQLHFLHVLKDAKPQARIALLASADDELIKANIECAINALNGNHKLNIDVNERYRNISIVYEHLLILKSISRVNANI